LAVAHFAASTTSAVAFPFGIYLSIAHESVGLAIGAALLWLAGAVLFLANLVRVFLLIPGEARLRDQGRTQYQPTIG
jgi:hypothetical protein